MAVDHYIASNFNKFKRPVLRFYGWKPYCISLGFHQSSNNIDVESLGKKGYELVKRPTGGRAIFHSEELTYSVIFPKTNLNQRELYIYIHKLFTLALKFIYLAVASNPETNPKLICNCGINIEDKPVPPGKVLSCSGLVLEPNIVGNSKLF